MVDNAVFVRNVTGLGFLGFVVSIGGRRPPIETTNRKNPKPDTFQTKQKSHCPSPGTQST